MRRRPRREDGFGLIEMLISLLVLSIGLLGLLMTFSSATVAIRRSGNVATASTLADSQLELYRALTYPAIVLDQASVNGTDSTYRTDPALPGGNIANDVTTSTNCTGVPNQCNPSRVVTGPDHGSYRIDTYVVSLTPAGGRAGLLVTVVVRNASSLSSPPFVRASSSFDQTTG